MSRLLNSYYPTTQLLLNSKYATQYVNNLTSNCVYSLNSPIDKPYFHQMLITIQNVNIPHSYYNIDSNNNTLNYTMNSINYTFAMTTNNYTINDLVSYINTNIGNNFTVSYSNSTNKLTFTNTTYDFTFKYTSICVDLLGLNNTSNQTSSSKILMSSRVCDLSYTKSLYINCNLNINTIDSRKALSYTNALVKIPVQLNYLSIETYENYRGYSNLLFEQKITNLNIFITDDNNNNIDLNGCNWDCSIMIDYIYNENIECKIPDNLLPNTNNDITK